MEAGQGLSELLAFAGIGHSIGDQALGDADADAGDVQPAAVQHLHGDLKALALRPQTVFGRYAHPLEIDVADVGALLAHLLFGLAHRQARQVARNQEGRDAGRALLLRIGPRHDGEQARPIGVGDEALGPIQHIGVALAPGSGLDRGGVRSGLGLGQGEGGDDFARGDAGQPLRLLLIRAEHHQALAADADIGAEGRAERRRGAAEFETDQAFLLHGKAQAAVIFGDRKAEQAEFPHLGHDLVRHGVVLGHLGLDRPQPLGHEPAHRLDQLISSLDIESHGVSPALPAIQRRN